MPAGRRDSKPTPDRDGSGTPQKSTETAHQRDHTPQEDLDPRYESIVAEVDSSIIGFVSLLPRGLEYFPIPILFKIYVQRQHSNLGVGNSLFVQGIRRLSKEGQHKVHCDFISSDMERLYSRLPDELKSVLDVKRGYKEWDIAQQMKQPYRPGSV